MNQGNQLGDFIKGRLAFIRDQCDQRAMDFDKALKEIETVAVERADRDDHRKFLTTRVFQGSVLPSSVLPDWVDALILKATTRVLEGPGGALVTTSSRRSCIPFEAGRYNAQRQADSVFRIMFTNKAPQDWLDRSFGIIYKKCYGEKAAQGMHVEAKGVGHYLVNMNNQNLIKAGPMDCTTILGYLFGAMEALNAHEPVVEHIKCGVKPGQAPGHCLFEVRWAL